MALKLSHLMAWNKSWPHKQWNKKLNFVFVAVEKLIASSWKEDCLSRNKDVFIVNRMTVVIKTKTKIRNQICHFFPGRQCKQKTIESMKRTECVDLMLAFRMISTFITILTMKLSGELTVWAAECEIHSHKSQAQWLTTAHTDEDNAGIKQNKREKSIENIAQK